MHAFVPRLLRNGIDTLFPVQSSSYLEMMSGGTMAGRGYRFYHRRGSMMPGRTLGVYVCAPNVGCIHGMYTWRGQTLGVHVLCYMALRWVYMYVIQTLCVYVHAPWTVLCTIAGVDVIGKSPTGTGKTLAFGEDSSREYSLGNILSGNTEL